MSGYRYHVLFMLIGLMIGALVFVIPPLVFGGDPPSPPQGAGEALQDLVHFPKGWGLSVVMILAWGGTCLGLGGVFGWKAGARIAEHRLKKLLDDVDA